jgi:hypothetical protein
MKLFRKDRQDKMRNESVAASRIRNLGTENTLEGSDPEEVARRLRNMNYGSTSHKVLAARG